MAVDSPYVLVVDGGAQVVALVDDRLATLAIDAGWRGVSVNGYVRDTAALANLPFGVMGARYISVTQL